MNTRGTKPTTPTAQVTSDPPESKSEPSPATSTWTDRILTRADQTVVIVLALFGIIAMAAWWIGHGGCRGNIIHIEHAELQVAQFQIDINSAEWNELIQLPGIGPTYATRILESRANEGPFATPEDLLRVHGIGPKRLEQMRPYLASMGDEERTGSPK